MTKLTYTTAEGIKTGLIIKEIRTDYSWVVKDDKPVRNQPETRLVFIYQLIQSSK